MKADTIPEIEAKIEEMKNLLNSWNFEKPTRELYQSKIELLKAEIDMMKSLE
jgi:hypothetical protein